MNQNMSRRCGSSKPTPTPPKKKDCEAGKVRQKKKDEKKERPIRRKGQECIVNESHHHRATRQGGWGEKVSTGKSERLAQKSEAVLCPNYALSILSRSPPAPEREGEGGGSAGREGK